MKRILLSLAASALLTGPLRADEKAVKVPFELLKSRHMVVNVKVNGKGPYRLIFDTGAPTMLVTSKVAKEAEVFGKNFKQPAFAPFGAMGQSSLKTLDVGGVSAKDVPCMVMDHPTVAEISKHFGPIEGIVGFPFFARFTMTVDYQAKEMTFTPNGYKPADIMQSLMNTLTARSSNPDAVKVLVPAAQWGFTADKGESDEAAGLTVKLVLKDSAADAAGLKVGDRLLTLDGRWTDTPVDLFEAAAPIKPGRATVLKVKRGDKELDLKVTPKAGL
jgi:hypothetical protein